MACAPINTQKGVWLRLCLSFITWGRVNLPKPFTYYGT